MQRMLADAADSLAQVETVIRREGIECHWRMSGRFSGAYTPRHYREQESKVGTYNASAGLGTYMLPRERQREEIASDYYHGGMVVERTGQLHPALYYGGLLKAAHRAGAKLCAQCDAEKIERKGSSGGGGFRVLTSKGPI
jgi:glycine/D-amino acid oxidase-like deaminating enzyme